MPRYCGLHRGLLSTPSSHALLVRSLEVMFVCCSSVLDVGTTVVLGAARHEPSASMRYLLPFLAFFCADPPRALTSLQCG